MINLILFQLKHVSMGEKLKKEQNFIIVKKKRIKSREERRDIRSRRTGTGASVNETDIQEIANDGIRENFDNKLDEEVNISSSYAGENHKT